MNPVVQAQVTEFEKNNPMSALSTSDYFEVYSIYSIANGLLSEAVDPFLLHLRGSEFGLDGAGVIIQGEVCTDSDAANGALEDSRNSDVEFLFFQAKSGTKLEYGGLSTFFDAIYRFFDGTFYGQSDQIDDLIGVKEAVYSAALRRNPRLRCFFSTSGNPQVDPKEHIGQLIETNRSRFADLNIFSSIEIEVLGAQNLQDAYRRATNSIEAEVEISKIVTLPNHPSVTEAHIGYISAGQLIKLATTSKTAADNDINKAVFFDNIRDFDLNSDINKGVIEEIKKGDTQSFIFKNNGVTVVSKEIVRTGDRFRLTDYQIVNGCQTTNILFHCLPSSENIQVPFRLIVSKDDDFVASIIIGTNKQNIVREEQFWALRPLMKNLEEYSRNQDGDSKLFIERRENQYRNEAIEQTRIVKPRDLVKAVAAMFFLRPNRAARDYRAIRKEFEDQIFLKEHSVEPYHIAAYGAYRFDWMIRNQRIPRHYGIYKYYALYSVGRFHLGGSDIFSLKPRKVSDTCREIMTALSNEAQFIKEIEKVAKVIDHLMGSSRNKDRESVRDQIRSETFLGQFSQKMDVLPN